MRQEQDVRLLSARAPGTMSDGEGVIASSRTDIGDDMSSEVAEL